MSVKTIAVQLLADSSRLEQGMRRGGHAVAAFARTTEQSGRAVKTTTTGIARDFDGLSSILNARVIGLTTATAGMALALHKGWERFTTIENASASLAITLGDTAKVTDLLNQTLAVVQGTPFNLDQFINAGKNLIAVGEDASRVPDILRAIGEAAAASGNGAEGVNVITDALIRMLALGRVSLEELNSLSYQGIPALQILANTFGVNTEEMRKMVSDGAVPARVAIDALVNGIMKGTTGAAGATKALEGSMESLRKTTSGALGGMMSAISRFGAGIIGLAGGGRAGEVNNLAAAMNDVSSGLDSVTRGLERVRPAAQWLGEHREIVEAIAVVYGLKLASSLAVTIARFAGLRAASLASAGALIPMVVGLENILRILHETNPEVHEFIELFASLKPEKPEDYSAAFAAAAAEIDRLRGKLAGMSGWSKFWDSMPWGQHKAAKTVNDIEAIRGAFEAFQRQQTNLGANVGAVWEAMGGAFQQMKPADFDRISAAAAKLGVNLKVPIEAGGPAREKVIGFLKGVEDGSAAASLQAAKMKKRLEEIQEEAKKIGDTFASAFSVLGAVELPDAAKAAEDLATARSSVADATERLADAQDKVRDNLRYLVRTPERDRELARARLEVAKAEQELAKAQRESAEAQRALRDPAGVASDQIRKNAEEMHRFVSNLGQLVGKVDARFLLDILAKGPKEAAPILDALVRDSSGGLARIVNASVAEVEKMREHITKTAEELATGVDTSLRTLPDTVLRRTNEALRAPLNAAYGAGQEVGQAYSAGIAAGIQPGSEAALNIAQSGRYLTPPLPVPHLATGGIRPHIARAQTVIYGEPSTGGEAYIPLGPQHRGRSTMLLAEVARQFGYGVSPVAMARGGMIGGGGGPSVVNNYNYNSGPRTESRRGGDVHVGQVVAHDYDDFKRQMARDRRYAALRGGYD